MARSEGSAGLHFLHIGKTGGTTFKKLVRTHHLRRRSDRTLIMHNHSMTLPEVLGADALNQAAFFLRDPTSRFVSGFNSRLREGAPSKNIPLKPEEKIAFEHFPTPNDLAEALDDDDLLRQDRAFAAMEAMVHTRMHYTRWLRDVDYLTSRLPRIMFIGFQETYAEDVARFVRKLHVEAELKVEHHHQAPPSSATTLSDRAVANLRHWYAEDVVIYEWALSQRDHFAE